MARALCHVLHFTSQAFVVAAGAAFDAWHGLGGENASSAAALAAAAGPALLRWTLLVGGLLGAALAALNFTVGGRVFTGAFAPLSTSLTVLWTEWTCAHQA